MEHKKFLNLLIKASNSNFVTREWNIFNDQSHAYNTNYDVGNEFV